MTGFVLDASAALGWLLDDPPSAYALRIQRRMIEGVRPAAPVHWHLEIANAVLSAARRKSLRRAASDVVGDMCALLPFVEQDFAPDDLGTLVSLGQRLQVSKYPPAEPGALWCEPLKAAIAGSLTRPRLSGAA